MQLVRERRFFEMSGQRAVDRVDCQSPRTVVRVRWRLELQGQADTCAGKGSYQADQGERSG